MSNLVQLPGYDLAGRLGRGAGAVIYLAIDRASRRQVAVKHVVRNSPDDDRFVIQAENEYEVSTRLNHPVLRKCYEITRIRRWLTTRELFLVMEYVDGVRLEDQCPERLTELLPIFIQVAEALHATHLAGYLHADIKPNNILLTRSGAVKIIDFGQSCPLGHRKTRLQGTPDFMAPEQVERRKLDHRTDIFNLGATLYWVVTGKWFRTMMPAGVTGDKKIQIESRRGSEPPHAINPRVPLSLSKLIMECCEASPEARPPDMRKVASRLEVVLHLLDRRDEEIVIRPAVGS